MINNFDREFLAMREREKGKRLLLHACCAPCSSYCLSETVDYFDVDVFFYNPNIDTEEEYKLRLEEEIRFVKEVYGDKVKVIDGGYNKEEFLNIARGKEDLKEGGARCYACYALRLDKAARYALDNNYDLFATTLTVSPLKNARYLNEIGEKLSNKYGVKYLYSDFKKREGYKKSIELSSQYSLYRQNYCGCEFSKKKDN